MSLVPRQQLHETLTMVHLQQNGLQDRLSLAVPIQYILSYNETKLVTQVEAIESGLILTLAIPMASKSTVMNVVHAIPIPMPDGDTGKALVWRQEAKYMAVSDDGEELAITDDKAQKLYWVPKICNTHKSHTYSADSSVLHGYTFIPRRLATCIATLSIGCYRITID